MPYTELEHLSGAQFKRLCGVSRETFGQMVEVLRPHLDRPGRRGRQAKLSVEDQLLVALEYWREYRSQFHIGTSWGMHETTRASLRRRHTERALWLVLKLTCWVAELRIGTCLMIHAGGLLA